MNEIMNVTEKTPIEIALQVDEDGYTTAKKLYDWLELEPSNYSRWMKTNIINNSFAIEGEDYIPLTLDNASFVVKDERNYNPNPTIDYMISASFAKRLCMVTKSHKGEEAREYFIGCEKGLKIAIKKYVETVTALKNTVTILQDQINQLSIETHQKYDQIEERMDILDAGSSRREEQDYQEALELSRQVRVEVVPLMNARNYKGKNNWDVKGAVKEICNIADRDDICHGYTLKAARDTYNRETGYMERNNGCFPANAIVIVHSYPYLSAFYEALREFKNEYREYTSEELIAMGIYCED